MDAVALANPLGSLTASVLRKKRDSPTMTDEHWLRFVCNVATSLAGKGISPEAWDALAEPGLDVDRDLTGLRVSGCGVRGRYDGDRRPVVGGR
jgi:hypothetical protein